LSWFRIYPNEKNLKWEADRHREERARVSRVQTLGELTASLAHEINQNYPHESSKNF